MGRTYLLTAALVNHYFVTRTGGITRPAERGQPETGSLMIARPISTALLLTVLFASDLAPHPISPPPTLRFTEVSIAPGDLLAERAGDITHIIGATYAVTGVPTEILGTESPIHLSPEERDGSALAEDLATEIALGAEAQQTVAEIADELLSASGWDNNEAEIAELDDGVGTLSVMVAPVDVNATHDAVTGEYILETSTEVASLDEYGVETVELIETIARTDPASEIITTLTQLDTEDYIAAGLLDSTAPDPDSVEGTEGILEPAVVRSPVLRTGLSAANKKKVANYALKYALKPNKNYREMTADCTNFASQALTAGGWKAQYGWYQDNRHWWYNGIHQSRSWGGAENWFAYAQTHSKRTSGTAVHRLAIGDIVQIKFKGQRVINHTMVVTKKIGKTVYVSYHSRNVKNKKLSDVMRQNVGETYFYHKV